VNYERTLDEWLRVNFDQIVKETWGFFQRKPKGKPPRLFFKFAPWVFFEFTPWAFLIFTPRVFFKKTHTLPLGILRAKCLKTLKKPSINPLGK